MRALKRVVKRLGYRKELGVTVNQPPFGADSKPLQHRQIAAKHSATPPPYAVELIWHIRTPLSSRASAATSFIRSSPTSSRYRSTLARTEALGRPIATRGNTFFFLCVWLTQIACQTRRTSGAKFGVLRDSSHHHATTEWLRWIQRAFTARTGNHQRSRVSWNFAGTALA